VLLDQFLVALRVNDLGSEGAFAWGAPAVEKAANSSAAMAIWIRIKFLPSPFYL
jgi:hypothetical protein